MSQWIPPEGGLGSPGPPEGGYPPEKKDDKALTQAVRDALILDPNIDSERFSVRTVNGTVYLGGVARSERERQRVRDLALGIDGVREVVDEMQVSE